jgi:cytochrome c
MMLKLPSAATFQTSYSVMPWDAPGTLSDDEVYELVAWVLFQNRIVADSQCLDAKTLPGVTMPARELFYSVVDTRR